VACRLMNWPASNSSRTETNNEERAVRKGDGPLFV